jgi:tetratricopeptide (TPR) repeat protein
MGATSPHSKEPLFSTVLPCAGFALTLLLLFTMWTAKPFLIMRGELEKAKQLYEREIEKKPGTRDWKLFFGFAQCLIQLDELEAASEMCDRAIALAPKEGVPYVARGTVAYECSRYQDALNDCEKAVSLGCPEKYVYPIRAAANIALKKLDDALADCDRLQSFSTGVEIGVVHILRSVVASYKGNFNEAIEHCNAVLKLDPKNVIALNNRGHFYTALGRLDKARADLQLAESLKCPPRVAFHISCAKAQLALKEGDIRSALTYADKALQQRPNSPCVLFAHALVLTRNGDASGALAELDRAINIDPYSGESYWARSKAYEALSQPDKAEQDKQAYERLGYHPYL